MILDLHLYLRQRIWTCAACFLFLLSLCLPGSADAQEFFHYRIFTPESGDLRELPDSSSESLATLSRGVALMETGMRDRQIVVQGKDGDWIQVAYFGDVGWVPLNHTALPQSIRTVSTSTEFLGTWRSNLKCRIQSYIHIEADGMFYGSHCISCTMEGCPESISGKWTIEDGMLVLTDKKGQKAHYFIKEGVLVSDPTNGFIWEYHGASVLSGLRK